MILALCPLRGRTGHQAAWALLEQTYKEQVGGTLPPVLRQPGGKPDFAQGMWHFSLSHTKKHAICALSLHPVGVDGEEQDRVVDLRLAEKILSPGEKLRFDSAEDKNTALLTFWVLKEAQVKCTGEGLRGYPRDTDFSLTDPRVRLLDGCLVAVVEAP